MGLRAQVQLVIAAVILRAFRHARAGPAGPTELCAVGGDSAWPASGRVPREEPPGPLDLTESTGRMRAAEALRAPEEPPAVRLNRCAGGRERAVGAARAQSGHT